MPNEKFLMKSLITMWKSFLLSISFVINFEEGTFDFIVCAAAVRFMGKCAANRISQLRFQVERKIRLIKV